MQNKKSKRRRSVYDDVFRTMTVMSSELVLPLLNEMCGDPDRFNGTEKVETLSDDLLLVQPDLEQEKRITDSLLRVSGHENEIYHLECQSSPDGTILVRMFEYDSRIALKNAVRTADTLRVRFPRSGVLYLRSNASTPDRLKVVIQVPGGVSGGGKDPAEVPVSVSGGGKDPAEVSYEIAVLKAGAYTIDDIIQKRLYFLVPFFIFNYDHLERYEADANLLAGMCGRFEELYRRLSEERSSGRISEHAYQMVVILAEKVKQQYTEGYRKVRKEVGRLMGGQVLTEIEPIKSYLRGMREGRAEGRAEGKIHTLVHLVNKHILSVEEAVREAGVSEEEFRRMLRSLSEAQE